ncbi:hypothetical protein Bbelb_290750 [Branchiostoma belcheri]|nr:hypothetical protein Bbelb_290750 [Branchiostoma belcheri]
MRRGRKKKSKTKRPRQGVLRTGGAASFHEKFVCDKVYKSSGWLRRHKAHEIQTEAPQPRHGVGHNRLRTRTVNLAAAWAVGATPTKPQSGCMCSAWKPTYLWRRPKGFCALRPPMRVCLLRAQATTKQPCASMPVPKAQDLPILTISARLVPHKSHHNIDRMACGYFGSDILPNQYWRICNFAGIGEQTPDTLRRLRQQGHPVSRSRHGRLQARKVYVEVHLRDKESIMAQLREAVDLHMSGVKDVVNIR